MSTTPAFVREVVSVLREKTPNITIGESDGGYHSFRAEEASASHGLYEMEKHFGVRVVNLSGLPAEIR